MDLRVVMMETVGRVIIRHCGVFNMGLQAMMTTLNQEGQHLKIFYELFVVVVRLVISLKSA